MFQIFWATGDVVLSWEYEEGTRCHENSWSGFVRLMGDISACERNFSQVPRWCEHHINSAGEQGQKHFVAYWKIEQCKPHKAHIRESNNANTLPSALPSKASRDVSDPQQTMANASCLCDAENCVRLCGVPFQAKFYWWIF
jgi:hypothetical protein